MAFDVVQARKEAFDRFDRRHGGHSLYVKQMGILVWPDGATCPRDAMDMAAEPDPERQDEMRLVYQKEKLERELDEFQRKFDDARARANPIARDRWGVNAAAIPSDAELKEIERLRDAVRATQREVNRLQEIVDQKYAERRPRRNDDTNRTCVGAVNSRLPVPARAPPQFRNQEPGVRRKAPG